MNPALKWASARRSSPPWRRATSAFSPGRPADGARAAAARLCRRRAAGRIAAHAAAARARDSRESSRSRRDFARRGSRLFVASAAVLAARLLECRRMTENSAHHTRSRQEVATPGLARSPDAARRRTRAAVLGGDHLACGCEHPARPRRAVPARSLDLRSSSRRALHRPDQGALHPEQLRAQGRHPHSRARASACYFGFFSVKSWLFILVMMGGGIALRRSCSPIPATSFRGAETCSPSSTSL